MSNVIAHKETNYLFKVTVMAKTAVKIDDLGGITLKSGETVDLGKKFPLDRIKISGSLAEHIWEGNIWAWDSCGNQVGGWELCEVEENLANSCDHKSKDIRIVKCMEGCETDVVSDYVALMLSEKKLINIYQERKSNEWSPSGTLWNFDGWNTLPLDLHGMRVREWVSLLDYLKNKDKSLSDLIDNELLMLDRKTERYYKFKFVNVKKDSEGNTVICYIRQTIKEALNECCEDTTEVIFSSNIPDVCDTYLFKDGISSNLTPYLTKNAQTLSGLKISYQGSVVREGKSVSIGTPQAYSSYVLNIVIDDNKSFQIPLPGGKNTGTYLDICNATPWDLVEFFEGKSEYWRELFSYYQKFLDSKELIYMVLKEKGCILGIKSNKDGIVVPLPKNAENRVAYSIDSEIIAQQEAHVKKLEAEFSGATPNRKEDASLFLTGNKLYDLILRMIYQIRRFAFVHGDKVSIFVSCTDAVRSRQEAAIAEDSLVAYCQNLTNVSVTLMFTDYCDFTPIDGIDGRIWGSISNDTGAAIPGALVCIYDKNNGKQYKTNTDDEGSYVFESLGFGEYEWSVNAKGFEEGKLPNLYLTAQEPSCEASSVLNVTPPDLSADVTGYVYDSNGDPIFNANVELGSKGLGVSVEVNTNEDGYYEFIDALTKNTDGKSYDVSLDVYSPGYSSSSKELTFNGTDDLSWNFNLNDVYRYQIQVTGKDLMTSTYSSIGGYVEIRDVNDNVIGSAYVTTESNIAYFILVADDYVLYVTSDFENTYTPISGQDITVSESGSFSAQLSRRQYTINSVAGAGGTVSGSTGNYEAGTAWQLTATPDDGYTFNGWSNDLGGDRDTALITGALYEDVTWTASFAANES